MLKANIFDIQRSSFVDGPGIRTTVFFKGCNLNCMWCHNPESQLSSPQMMIFETKCISCGKCLDVCPNNHKSCDFCGKCALLCSEGAREICGKQYTVEQVLTEILKDKSFYEASLGGATLSGGECMLQIDFVHELLKECKKFNIHTAIDTAGCVPYEHFERILHFCDLFLYDLKLFDSDLHKKYTGKGNSLILNNLSKLLTTNANVWVRIPIISGINDNEAEMLKIKSFFDKTSYPRKIELLPYHSLGEHKYSALGMEERRFSAPSKQKLDSLKKIFNI